MVRLRRPRAGDLRFELLIGLALKGGGAGASFVFNLLLARALGGAAVGEFQLALSTAWLAAAVALLGLDMLVMRAVSVARHAGRFADARASVRRGTLVTLGFGAALAALLWLASPLLADRLFAAPALTPFVAAMAVTVPLLAFIRMASGALRGVGNLLVSQSLDGIGYTGVAALVVAAVMLLGLPASPLLSVDAFIAGTLATAAFGGVHLWRLVRGWPVGGTAEVSLRAGVPLVGTFVLLLFSEWAAVALLTREHGSLVAGNYRVIFQFCNLFLLVSNSFSTIVGPHIAAAYAADDPVRIGRVARLAALAGGATCLPLLLALLVLPELLLGLFDPAFAAGATAMRIYAAAQFINVCAGPLGTILIMTHREKWMLQIELVATTTGVALSLVLIPSLGLLGAAIAGATGLLTRNAITLTLVLLRMRALRAAAA